MARAVPLMRPSTPVMADETENDRIAMEKNAGLIMATNNSSIVSKRSVEILYLPEPHFYKYFVGKPQRRAPTINRGYWLRMQLIDRVVQRFLRSDTGQPRLVLNLGCGYDPIPFTFLAREREICENTKFIDIDFEELMKVKTTVVSNTRKMRDLLTEVEDSSLSEGILFQSAEYIAIGCDLRNPPRLQRLLKKVVNVEQYSILCIAEVSITYMKTEDADAIITWAPTLSPDVTFCLLEQGSPDQPDHPFTRTMVSHFEKLGSPLCSLFRYPGNHSQTARFMDAGWTHVESQNLWQLWADPRFFSPSQRLALDHVEPFDEWEEFILFASHYNLVIAQTVGTPLFPEPHRTRRDSCASIDSEISTRTVSPYREETQWFGYKYWKNSNREGRVHHGSAYAVPEHDGLAIYGGIGPQGRLNSTSVYAARNSQFSTPLLVPPHVQARCCHTLTTMNNGQNILIGGRASPKAPLRDCWLQTASGWERIQDLPEPLYRHRTAPVILPSQQHGIIVFGGKTSSTTVTTTTLLWDRENGWQKLRLLKGDPIPRFGSMFMRLGYNHGLLFGGMRQDGVICQGLWKWRLIVRDMKVIGISFRESSALDASAGVHPWFARFGASYSVIRNELLLIGGVAKAGTIPKMYEILSVLGSFSAFNEFEQEMPLRLGCVEPVTKPDVPRPLLIGHASHRTLRETTLIIGGGCTCFSFGSYWNEGVWLMFDREAGETTTWTLLKDQHIQSAKVKPAIMQPGTTPRTLSLSALPPVNCITLTSPKDFTSILRQSVPMVIKSLDFGSCTRLWNPNYLKSKTLPSRAVVVHAAPNRIMNFTRKDFAYTTLPFHAFLTLISSTIDPSITPHMYMRSISSSNPAKAPADLETDWPELAADFQIPSELDFVRENMHSNPLRISANVNMWLHFDVMANVLFQIHGTKKLVLYPPKDIKHLSFAAGFTTSSLNVLEADPQSNSGSEDRLQIVSGTNPVVAVLKPGDALFIPPLWAHVATPISSSRSTSIKASGTAPSPLEARLAKARATNRAAETGARASDSQASDHSQSGPSSSNSVIPIGSSSTPIGPLDLEQGKRAVAVPDTKQLSDQNLQSTNNSVTTEAPENLKPAPWTPYTELPLNSADSPVNISLNTFFRSLPANSYAAGRDVYGNRDLAAYEESRRDLERIVKKFVSQIAKEQANDEKGGSVKAEAQAEAKKLRKEEVRKEKRERGRQRQREIREKGKRVQAFEMQDLLNDAIMLVSEKTEHETKEAANASETVNIPQTGGPLLHLAQPLKQSSVQENHVNVPEHTNVGNEIAVKEGTDVGTAGKDADKALVLGLPRSVAKAYLERLGAELLAKAAEL